MHGLFFRRSSSGLAIAVVAVLLLASRESCGANIALSGFNEDVVTEIGASPFAHRFDGWGASLIEQGAKDTSGRTATVGLPPARQFASATGSGVTYFLQPYDADNALRMGDGDPQTGAMTVVSGQYSALHILTASGTGGGAAEKQAGDVILNFVDGSVILPGALIAYDWGTGPANDVAIGGMARNLLGGVSGGNVSVQYASDYSGVVQPIAYKLYETTINLSSLGLSARTLKSVGFTNAEDTFGATDVMAIDGASSVPEPAALTLLTIGGLGLGGVAIRRRALQSLPLLPALCASAQPVSPINRKRWRKSP
jgi:hypothetical protein